MKKILLAIVFALIGISCYAQIPYFAGTIGDRNIYTYTSLKVRPGNNAQESYSTIQYGIGNYFATGADLCTNLGSSFWGILARTGIMVSKNFGIGAQITPSFKLNDSFKFAYLSSALYMNGAITNNEKLFWCSNTIWCLNNGNDITHTIEQWTYLGYTIRLNEENSLTPMAGEIHSWRFDENVDIALGAYYTHRNFDFFLWGNDFFKRKPRVVVGIDYIF